MLKESLQNSNKEEKLYTSSLINKQLKQMDSERLNESDRIILVPATRDEPWNLEILPHPDLLCNS